MDRLIDDVDWLMEPELETVDGWRAVDDRNVPELRDIQQTDTEYTAMQNNTAVQNILSRHSHDDYSPNSTCFDLSRICCTACRESSKQTHDKSKQVEFGLHTTAAWLWRAMSSWRVWWSKHEWIFLYPTQPSPTYWLRIDQAKPWNLYMLWIRQCLHIIFCLHFADGWKLQTVVRHSFFSVHSVRYYSL